MKNYLCLLIAVFLWCVLMPTVVRPSEYGQATSNIESEEKQDVSVSKISVRYYDNDEACVKNIDLEEYVQRALAYIMDENTPFEALKAQAVAIRSVVCYRHENIEHEGYELCCDEEHCFQISKNAGEIHKRAVAETGGEILTFEDKAALALSHHSSFEITESYEFLSGVKLPYLVSVPVFDKSSSYGHKTVSKITPSDFESAFSDYNIKFDGNYEDWIGKSEYTKGKRVYTINVGGLCFKGSTFARLLKLDSLCFEIDVDNEGFVINSYGKGTGLGMSRCSARMMAEDGKNYIEILKYFYPETKLLVIKNV